MLRKKTVRDIDLAGRRALVRVDFNLPLDPGTGEVADDRRIRATIPTLEYLLERGCRLVLCSHLGRPRGRVVEGEKLDPIARRLGEIMGKPVLQADCYKLADSGASDGSSEGQGIVMLPNLRFHPGEENNDFSFALKLASNGDVFVNDAFGAAHRAHASTVGVTAHLPSVAGLLMETEIATLSRLLEAPRSPFTIIVGGAKVSDKIGVLQNLLPRADRLLIGGGMAATFMRALGRPVGDSLVEDEMVESAGAILARAEALGVDCRLPTDFVLGDRFAADADTRISGAESVPGGWRIMDIGLDTARDFADAIGGSGAVLWNGPMGVFEFRGFAAGTAAIGEAVASLEDADTVVGGGSTAHAVDELGLTKRMTHVSTGGGACLEFLEGRSLPGVAALMDAE